MEIKMFSGNRVIGGCAAVLLSISSFSACPAFANTANFLISVERNYNVVDNSSASGPLLDLLAYKGGYDIRGGMDFDISAIPPYAQITNAVLRTHYDGASGGAGLTLQFDWFVGHGAIDLVDYTNATPILPRYNSFGPGTPDGYYVVPVTTIMQTLVTSHASHAGFIAQNIVTNQTELDGSLGLHPPELDVTYSVPEPSSLLTLASLIAPQFLRRARRSS